MPPGKNPLQCGMIFKTRVLQEDGVPSEDLAIEPPYFNRFIFLVCTTAPVTNLTI